MRDSIRLGRVAGFPVAVNWSVLVVLLLLAWSLAEGVLPGSAPGRGAGTYWLAGVVGALLLLCSLLAHELAHAILAQRSGLEVDGVTLWMFGGVATLKGEPKTPGADFRIAAVGPATSIGLGLVFGVVVLALDAGGAGTVAVAVAAWLATINVVLAVFNLIPGAPLDGGRILRAALWRRSGDRVRAAETATNVGQVVAYCLVGLGLVDFLAGDAVGGLWLMFIGWFVLTAARAEYAATMTESLLRGVTVSEVMSTPVETGSADLTVQEFVNRCVLGGRHSAHPVLGSGGEVLGLVTLEQLRRVPPAQRGLTPVRAVAVPLAHVAVCGPRDPVEQLLPRLTRESGNRALVFDRGGLIGIVTPADVTRAFETQALLRADDVVAPRH